MLTQLTRQRTSQPKIKPLRLTILFGLSLVGLGLLYLALVLLRHYAFATHAHDLGIFDQGAWHYSLLQAPYSSLKGYNLLGDHFTPVLALAAPFYWLYNGPATLLALQVAVVFSGVWPAWRLAGRYLAGSRLRYYPPLFYLLFFGVQNTLNFDFHTDTLAAAFFLWAIWFWEARRLAFYLTALGLVLLCKETMPVYMSFWALCQLIRGQGRKLHTGLIIAGLVLFLAELNVLLPFFAGRPYYYNDYGQLGHSMGEVALNSLRHPDWLLAALFGESTKLESWLVFFVASGGALLVRPAFLIMLIPNVIERFLNPQPPRWSLYFHYSAILAPFFTYAVVLALARYRHTSPRWQTLLAKKLLTGWLALVLFLNSFVYSSFLGDGFGHLSVIGQYSATWHAIGQIPPSASVLANSPLVPHLTHRAQVDEFFSPEPAHAEFVADYVLISAQVERNPTEYARLLDLAAHYQTDPAYRLIYQTDEVWLFQHLS